MVNLIVIIDGNSLINRAYYAMQRPMITKEGLYTHGVYGFLNILNKIKNDYDPEYLIVTFDRKAPTFRHEEYKEYKAGRKKMPPELAMQLPLLKEVLEAMNITMLEIDGFEADDIIGTIAKNAENSGLDPLIITGDKDELQLATDKTKVLITKKGISEFEIYDKSAMIEKYGFTPEQFIDYKGLMGDQSDNIPGIPGVGEKTAQKLILEFGSVANLLENVESVSNAKLKQKIEDYAQQAIMSRRLAEINTDVPIDYNLDECKFIDPDFDKLIPIYTKLEFNSFLKKLKLNENMKTASKAIVNDESTAMAGTLFSGQNPEPVIIKNNKEFTKLEKLIKKSTKEKSTVFIKVFSDNNHRDIPKINGVSLLFDDNYFYVNTSDEELLQELKTILMESNVNFAGHNLIHDYYPLLAEYKDIEKINFNTVFDTGISQYLLEPTRSNYLLKTLLLEYFHEELPEESDIIKKDEQMTLFESNEQDKADEVVKKYAEYGAKWCIGVQALKTILEEKIKKENLIKVYEEIELPLIEVMATMESFGFYVDKKELTDRGENLKEQIIALTEKIHELAGEDFNIGSPSQLGKILFEKLKLPTGKKNKTGYSTNAEVLEKLRDEHEIVDYILEYRTLTKLNSTYIEGLLPLIHTDHRIHAHFQQTVTATGRLSCTEPNLQNIPIKQELGRKIRRAFTPEGQDKILVGADYSQIELRVLAHMAGDESLIEAFNNGDDIHKITAAKVFGVSEDDVTPLQRSNAKAVNFGVIYGMSGFGLSTEISVSRKEAEKYIDEYFNKYKAVKKFMDKSIADCKANGYVTTLMDRKRVIHEINASNYNVRNLGERLAMNTPIQGSAADIIKLAMINVYKALKENGFKSKLILQVHDELIIETYKDELEDVKKLLKEKMESAMELSVKLVAEVNTGANWYDLK